MPVVRGVDVYRCWFEGDPNEGSGVALDDLPGSDFSLEESKLREEAPGEKGRNTHGVGVAGRNHWSPGFGGGRDQTAEEMLVDEGLVAGGDHRRRAGWGHPFSSVQAGLNGGCHA